VDLREHRARLLPVFIPQAITKSRNGSHGGHGGHGWAESELILLNTGSEKEGASRGVRSGTLGIKGVRREQDLGERLSQ
jgi:hypothetical protein